MTKRFNGLTTIVILIFIGLLLIPFVLLLSKGFSHNGHFYLGHVKSVFTDQIFLPLLGKSVWISLVAGVLATATALMVSYTIRKTKLNEGYKRLLGNVIVLPMLLPSITYGFTLIYLFGENGIFKNLFNHSIIQAYGTSGVILGYFIYIIGPVFFIVDNGFRYLDGDLYKLSYTLNDTKVNTFRNVTLIGMKSSLISGVFVGFTLAFTDFGVPMSLNYMSVSRYLYTTILGAVPDFEKGSIVALILLVLPLLTYVLIKRFGTVNEENELIGKIEVNHHVLRDRILLIGSLFIMFVIILILSIVFIAPFVESWPTKMNFTLDNWSNLMMKVELGNLIGTTLKIALLTVVFGTLLTFLAALITAKSRNRFKKLVDMLALAPNIIPGMTLGLGFLMMMNYVQGIPLIIMIVGLNVIHFFTSPYLLFKNALEKLNENLEHISYVLGDAYHKTVLNVVIKNIKGTVLEVASYLFITSFTTISALVFIADVQTETLALYIKRLEHFSDFKAIFVISFIILWINIVFLTAKKICAKRILKSS